MYQSRKFLRLRLKLCIIHCNTLLLLLFPMLLSLHQSSSQTGQLLVLRKFEFKQQSGRFKSFCSIWKKRHEYFKKPMIVWTNLVMVERKCHQRCWDCELAMIWKSRDLVTHGMTRKTKMQRQMKTTMASNCDGISSSSTSLTSFSSIFLLKSILTPSQLRSLHAHMICNFMHSKYL